jgi:hypothetical protein
MVIVIVKLLAGEHPRLWGRQAVKANSPRLKTIPFRVRPVGIADLGKLKLRLMWHRASSAAGGLPMSDQFWLTKVQLKRIELLFPAPATDRSD